MIKFELQCTDSRKSFYGKAHIIKAEDGNTYLQSYSTIVGYVDSHNKFHRTWDDYSATTMRHVNSFLDYCNIGGGGKAWWTSLPVEKSDLMAA